MSRPIRLSCAALAAQLALAAPASLQAQSGSSAGLSPACADVPGLEAVLDVRPARFVIVGEPHGTVEVPQFFADIVCEISGERPVLVALEIEDEMQTAIDLYLASNGSEGAKEALLAERFWTPKYPDGRSSQAIVELIERLRTMKSSGRDIQVVAFKNWDTVELGQGHMEISAAARLGQAAARLPGHAVLVLTGSFHARRTPPSDVAFVPMAGVFPRLDALTLDLYALGGEQWNCRSTCGSQELHRSGEPRPRGVWLEPVADGDFDARYSLGEPASPSPPARGSGDRITPVIPTSGR